MLDNLVESRSHKGESRKFRGLFGITSVMMMAILMTGFVVNLFSQELALGADNLELSTLVAPVDVPPEKPPIEIPEEQPKTKSSSEQTKVPTRKVNMQRLDETPVKVPNEISTTASANKARPKGYFEIGIVDTEATTKGADFGREKRDTGTGIGKNNAQNSEVIAKNDDDDKRTPPPVLEKPKPEIKKPVQTISKGVINGTAVNLVKPVYSAMARNVGAKGDVKIQVTISEDGNVISASVLDGHPLLRQSALRAAKSSKFTPTLLSGEKVKVKGIIIYKFS